MDFSEDIDIAQRYLKAATKSMEDLGIRPTPKNYAIWYAYHCDGYSEMKRIINILLESKEPFTEIQNEKIFNQFFYLGREVTAIREIGKKIEGSLARLNQIFGGAGKDASDYGSHLETFSGNISEDMAVEDLRSLVGEVLSQTRKMQETSKHLEKEMQRSSLEALELRKDLEVVRKESLTDSLTGIPNRKYFDQSLRDLCRDSMEAGTSLCLLMVDIDFFKKYNDKYGHQVGDEVLRLVGGILGKSGRGKDVAARYGGEEFAILLPGSTLEEAARVAERIRSSVATRKLTNRSSGEDYGGITLTIGLASFEAGESLESFVKRADEALYTGKKQGRNQVVSLALD